jgi:hypothetical protein
VLVVVAGTVTRADSTDRSSESLEFKSERLFDDESFVIAATTDLLMDLGPDPELIPESELLDFELDDDEFLLIFLGLLEERSSF